MQIILREEIAHLGDVGDVVNVKSGYARNFLLPRGLAVLANERQVKRVEHEKRLISKKIERMRGDAEERKKSLNKIVLVVRKAAGESGKLFGSVTTMEIDALLKEQGYEINRRKLVMPESTIKTVGEHAVGIKLHRDVTATITVIVQAEVAKKVEAVVEAVVEEVAVEAADDDAEFE
ncbi:MAG: large subunit ribosomal protein L9 [Bradymonadia bacterium]|jgi:large subunit ribosomal protein L9